MIGSVLAAAPASSVLVNEAQLSLPEAPGMESMSSSSAMSAVTPLAGATGGDWMAAAAAPKDAAGKPESPYDKIIQPGIVAPALSPQDKVILGLKSAFSPFAAIGWLVSAGYTQATNGSPNYGTDRGAFGQKLGAAAILNTSEGLLTDSVMAPILHEDPRFYRMGPGHNFLLRLGYAVTRPIITRTDAGRSIPNFALIAGNAGGSALTNLYYPQVNRGLSQTMQTLGGSIGGSAIGDVVNEFSLSFTRIFHIEHK